MDVIFATGNAGKLVEIREIMSDFIKKHDINLISLKDAGIAVDIVEDGNTFEENALIKARTISKYTDCMVLADDSGLEVDYLGKAPGVYSARYLGEDTSYTVKNNHILKELEGVADSDRSARFVCVIACVMPDGKEIVSRGTIEGQIGYEIKGENGFGYDPIFYLPERGCTTAELSCEEKNIISHRGRALVKMMAALGDELK